MIKAFFTLEFVLLLLMLARCGNPNAKPKSSSDSVAQTVSLAATFLDKLDWENKKRLKLKSELLEISGLALSSNGRLFAHDDETATIYELSKSDGNILKRFFVGKNKTKDGDFEDLAIIGERFFLVESNGNLLEFKEGADKTRVDFILHETKLKSSHDVEGLCYDPKTHSLLLACKGLAGKDYPSNYKAVYSFSIDKLKLEKTPRFLIDIDKLPFNRFAPSGIAFNLASKTFFVIAANGKGIIELSEDGAVLGSRSLDKSTHEQPEGIAIEPNGTLYIGDEGAFKRATLTIYPLKQ